MTGKKKLHQEYYLMIKFQKYAKEYQTT